MSGAPEQSRWDTNARQLHAEAAAWIERRESSTWDDAEKAEFEIWLSKSAAHTVAFLRAEDVWRRADRLRALGRPERRPIGHPRRVVFAKVGAAAMVLAIVGTLGVQFSRAPTSSSYATPIGGREVLTLKDGTRIELNTNTALRVAINRSERKVWLDRGEAFFDVGTMQSYPLSLSPGIGGL
jgi:transmembrane sensor